VGCFELFRILYRLVCQSGSCRKQGANGLIKGCLQHLEQGKKAMRSKAREMRRGLSFWRNPRQGL
jgi:hypothetical protein